jgi:hypothetical protein
MDAEPHIGESAELYAVGALDAAERAAVEAHIEGCVQCLRRVGEAEETVLALERGFVAEPARPAGKIVPFPPRGIAPWWLAVAAAAAFIVGMLIPHAAPQHDAATLAMIGSHFSHAQFSGSGPPAKVIYARDRSWYYVIVTGPHRYGVYGIRDGHSVALGYTQPARGTSELFTRSGVHYDRLELRDGATTIGTAAIR